MNADMEPITRAQMRRMLGDMPHAKTIYDMSAGADPLLCASLGDLVLGFMAFIPATTLSDQAYVWVQLMPAAADHKLAIGKLSRRWWPIIQTRYKRLVAHCPPENASWLAFIGGRPIDTENGLIRFTLEAPSE